MLFFLLWCCFFSSCFSARSSVVIIGAGSSGIAAATKLLENSFHDVTILEAESRIGGRIESVPLIGGAADLGAEYCHGEVGNVVYQTVKDLDLLDHSEPLANITKIYFSNGSLADNQLATGLLNDILKKYCYYYPPNETSFNWPQVLGKTHHENCEGDQRMAWRKSGFHTILDVLMKKIPKNLRPLPIDGKIKLNKSVARITWSENKAKVETLDRRVYKADHVIFTPSLKVLQNKNVVFNPPLPKKKLEAINSLGLAVLFKIGLHFDKPWWTSYILISWSEEDIKKSAKDFPYGYSKDGVSWITSIYCFTKSPNPNVLIAWATGYVMPEVEKLSDNVIEKGVMFVANKFLGKDYNISKLGLIVRSNWHSNRNFGGSYSYEKVEFYQKNISYNAILAEPLTHGGRPILQFAGEATSPTHYGSVHGAVESGWREAQRIIDLYKH